MKRKLYLTKSRLKRLHTEISINDILYREHEKMSKQISEYARHLNRTYKNVIQVRRKVGEYEYIEQIIDVKKVDGEGLLVTIV